MDWKEFIKGRTEKTNISVEGIKPGGIKEHGKP